MNSKEKFEEQLNKLYETIINFPEKEIEKRICKRLDKCGLMYHTFSRTKEKESTRIKIERKSDLYLQKNKKMQDIVGIRIVLYFKDDIDICISVLQQLFDIDNFEYDKPDAETFKPQRINYVFKMPEDVMKIPDELCENCLIDNTFEVQIRTIFSEGWHEVEHDIRYKYLDDWNVAAGLSRELNGIFAVLEICDDNIMSICERLAYRKYKEKSWASMLRNKFRLRFMHQALDSSLQKILSEDAELAKALYRFERQRFICFFAENNIPKTFNNIIYVINEIQLHNKDISQLAPQTLVEKCRNQEDACNFVTNPL